MKPISDALHHLHQHGVIPRPDVVITLNDAFFKAQRPELLRFAVIDQNSVDQRAAIKALPFAAQIRYVHIHPQETQGVSWARNLALEAPI